MLDCCMAKITLFGLAGTGTSTTGKALAARLGYQCVSSGNLAREEAKGLGMTISEWGEAGKKDPKFDGNLDKRIELFGKENKDFVVESWLAWHFIPDSIKIKLDCDFDVRIGRIAHRDRQSTEEAKVVTTNREKSNAERYRAYYGIENFSSNEHFDLVVDTTKTPVTQVVEQIEQYLRNNNLI